VKRNDRVRIQDALDAIEAIEAHLSVGSLSEGLVFDAVRMHIFEIGGISLRRQTRSRSRCASRDPSTLAAPVLTPRLLRWSTTTSRGLSFW
jgi:hypothetical protein